MKTIIHSLKRKFCYHNFKPDWNYGNMYVEICTKCGKHIVKDKAELDLKAK